MEAHGAQSRPRGSPFPRGNTPRLMALATGSAHTRVAHSPEVAVFLSRELRLARSPPPPPLAGGNHPIASTRAASPGGRRISPRPATDGAYPCAWGHMRPPRQVKHLAATRAYPNSFTATPLRRPRSWCPRSRSPPPPVVVVPTSTKIPR